MISPAMLPRVEAAVRAVAAGRMAIVRDSADREDEGDLVMAADLATDQGLAFMARLAGGLICVPVTADRARDLQLDPMSAVNTTPTRTAFLTPVDRHGSTTGISTAERAATARALGGSSVLGSFVDARLVNKYQVFIAPVIIDGRDAPSPVGGAGVDRLSHALHPRPDRVERVDGDLLLTCYPGTHANDAPAAQRAR